MWTLLIVGSLLLITVIVVPCVVEDRKEQKRQKIWNRLSFEVSARHRLFELIQEDRRHNDAEWLIFRREMLRQNLAAIRRLQDEYEQAGGEFSPDGKY